MSYAVVIPSKNSTNLLACVTAIREAGETCRIIVVDDGLDKRVSSCEYVEGVKPFCFSRNVNLGIRAAGTDDVLLLNDDAQLETPGGFAALAEQAKAHPEYGVIAAVTNNVGNPNQFRRDIGLREDKRMVCFICVYIPRTTLDKVGLLDERFVTYGMDDDDMCLRIRNAGLKIGIYDDCFVDHKHLNSTFRGLAGAGGDYRPSLKLFIEKWGHDNWGRAA